MDMTQQARGFTLIALIMVTLVLSVLVAVTAMRWNAVDSTAPYQADLLARNLRHMQILAMTWGQSLRFLPTPSNNGVTSNMTPLSGRTSRWNRSVGSNITGAGSTDGPKSSAGAVNLSWTWSGNQR